jgi:transposase
MTLPILGIDVSKKDLALALLIENSYKKYKVSNTPKGFKDLTVWLQKQGVDKVKACMEATGRYGEKLADYLYSEGHKVHILNPSCMKAFSKSKLSRHKTDDVDSLLIAEYASKHELRVYKPRDPVLKELRDLYHCLENLKQQQTQVGNFLENKDCLPESVKEIYTTMLAYLKTQIQKVELSLEQLLYKHPTLKQDWENLQTIPGVAKTTATAILAQTPDLSSFESARQLAAYAGLTPAHKTSGTSLKGKSKLSKIGSSALRKAIYFPAIVAKNHNPILKAFAQKLAKKGKHTMVIIGAIMRKLLHIAFAILKHKTTFNPEILKNNP